MLRTKQLLFDPGRMAVLVWSDSATHPSNQIKHQRNRSLVHIACLHCQYPSKPGTVSEASRSAHSLRPPVASHPTRCLSCHFTTSRPLNHSHHRIRVSRRAKRRSFVILSERTHRRASWLRPFPHTSRLSQDTTSSSRVSFERYKENLG